MTFRLSCLRILTFLCCLPVALLAQDTASITGTVTDSSGAAIPNAQVRVVSSDRGINRTTVTNGSGDYLLGSIPIGSIDVIVNFTGFKKFQAQGVVLRVGEKARLDVTLEVGSAGTTVTVEGSSVAQVETQSSDLGGTVNAKEISQLQLNGRDFKQLITLVPGVSNQTGSDEGEVGVTANNSFSVNGGRTEYNNWEMDGGDTMDNGSNNTLNVTPSIDAIGEFKVLTSNYGAQYGKNGSGTIEVETKSGTRAFHGDAYEFVRNDIFNSPAWNQDGVAPPYKKNDFGFTIGGPVTIPGVYNKNKQKTFFFWSEEWRRDRVPYTFNQEVPSLAERAGDFSDQCPNPSVAAPNNFADCPVVPGYTNSAGYTPNLNVVPGFNANDPNVVGLLSLISTPTTGSPGQYFYYDILSQPTNYREELGRIDHNLTDKERITFRYIHDSWQQNQEIPTWTNAGSFPTIQNAFSGPGVSMVARLSSALSPTLLNEFVASYTSDKITLQNEGDYLRPANMTIGQLYPGANRGIIPGINLNDPGGAYGGGLGEDPGYIPDGVYNSNPTYSYKDNVSKIVGKHNLEFGAYLEAAQKNELGAELAPGSYPGYIQFNPATFSGTDSAGNSVSSTGNPVADLELGYIAAFGQQSNQLKYYNRYKIVEPYFQDDFHATNHLTLNLGLRLSLYGTYRERYLQAFNFDPAAYNFALGTSVDSSDTVYNLTPGTGAPSVTNLPNGMVRCGAGGQPIGCQTGHLFNPAPRIGFAWDPKGDGKTAIRAGYGIFYEHGNGNETGTETLENSPPLATAAQVVNIVGYTNVGSSSGQAAPQAPLAPIAVPEKAIWPYVQQWHIDFQHELVRDTVATIAYVGSKGTHLTRQSDLNQLVPVPASQNPYKPGETYGPLNSAGTAPVDCGPVNASTGTYYQDAYGVPTQAMTPSGVSIPYRTNAAGLAVGPAVNLGVAACGVNPDPFRPFPGYSDIPWIQPASTSSYNALQIAVRRNVGGLQLNFAYTYSHSIDDSSDRYDASFVNAYDPASNRASSNYDERHILNFGYVWDVPLFRDPGFAHKVLGGWQYSGITAFSTGTPFSVINPTDNAGVGNGLGSSSYADLVGDPKAGVVQSYVPEFGPISYNPNAFAVPRGLTFGDSPRNLLRNPSQLNFDMALFKHFAITESKAFEFRAEAFNVFNHTEWLPVAGQGGSAASNGFAPGSTANDVGTTGFLRPDGVHEARVLQLALKFLF
jgi:hypothetical protein